MSKNHNLKTDHDKDIQERISAGLSLILTFRKLLSPRNYLQRPDFSAKYRDFLIKFKLCVCLLCDFLLKDYPSWRVSRDYT